MTPRKHAELIKAWADGAEIQRMVVFDRNKGVDWIDDPNPTWDNDEVYRRKPVQKADYFLNGEVEFLSRPDAVSVRVLFDGETREPKKVEIIK